MLTEYEVVKPIDLSRIDINNLGELLWWSYILDTTPELIVTIIQECSDSSEGVRIRIAARKAGL